MHYKKPLLTILAASLFAFSVSARSEDAAAPKAAEKPAAKAPNKAVSVNGVLIPQARFDFAAKMIAAQGQPETPETQTMLKEKLITQEMLVQEAVKKGLDKNAEVAMQLEMARQQILGSAAVSEFVKANPLKDEVLKVEYDKMTSKMGDKEYHARHILVEKEDVAKAIIAELNKKGDFAKIAKAKSKDTGSAKNGGDLEWNSPSRFVKPFSDAMIALEKGKFTQVPVKSDFGYHIIKLEDSRETKKPDFNQVKEQLRQPAQRQQVEAMIAEMRAKSKIEEK